MKYTIPFIMLVLLGVPLSAVENPNVRSRAGSATTVPSATRSALTPNRSYDAAGSGNDIMTGNIGGMRHFRGLVPYGSSYYTGSSAFSPVDDFLRRASDPIADDRSPGQYRSYYDPRRTVGSAVRADGTGLYSPVITERGQTDPYTPPLLHLTVQQQGRLFVDPQRLDPQVMLGVEYDGAKAQRVRTDRRDHDCRQAGRKDRPARRHTIRRRAGRGRYNQAVADTDRQFLVLNGQL